MVQGFDGVVNEGRVEGSHGLCHGSELAYAIDFRPFGKRFEMLDDVAGEATQEMNGEVGFSVALLLGGSVPTHLGTQCQAI